MRKTLLALSLIACNSKAPPPTTNAQTLTKPASSAPAAAAAPTKTTAAAAPASMPAGPTKAELAEYKKHMKAGWALQKQEKWADAVPEFEAALKPVPSDQHALAELGWSAMNAGDFKKAKKADLEALKVASDRNVKASGLYNLGLVLEKTGDKDGALKAFLESLQLRPNKTVEQEVGKLGATAASRPVWCGAGAKPCDCVEQDAFGEPDPVYECAEATDPAPPVKGFHVYHAHGGPDSYDYLLDEKNQLVDVIGMDSEHTHREAGTKLDKAELKTIGGHQVLRLETVTDEQNNFLNFDEADHEEEDDGSLTTRNVTICVVGDAKTATSCPLRDVMVSETGESSRTTDLDADKPTTKSTGKTDRATSVTIADDGTVTVKLVKGSSDSELDQMMGPHKLW